MQNLYLDQARLDHLRIKVDNSEGKTERLSAWARQTKDLPVVELELDFVRFSIKNHRTTAQQIGACRDAGDQELFTGDPLGDRAQNAQYKILQGLSGWEEMKGDLKRRKQQDSAVVTADGILVNGNRRAAGLRSLIQEGLLEFGYIRCVVLPADTSADEIRNLETELQVNPDLKRPYSWINEGLLIEELLQENDMNFQLVSNKTRIPLRDIRQMYDEIVQVNILVGLSEDTRLHMDFENNQAAFTEMTKYIKNKSGKEREVVQDAYMVGTLMDVPYRDLRHFRRKDPDTYIIKEIKDREALDDLTDFLSESGESEINGEDESGESEIDDVLTGILGGGDGGGTGEDGGKENLPTRRLLLLVAKSTKLEAIPLSNGATIDPADLKTHLNQAFLDASNEAKEQHEDDTVVNAPIMRLESAISDMQRARESLSKARAIGEWDEDKYKTLVEVAEEELSRVKSSVKE